MSSNERRNYCPVAVYKNDLGVQELALDVLNAAYEGLNRETIGYDSFQVTDAEAGQPDAIAWNFYSNSALWWIICTFNGIIDPYTEIVAGLKLKIPRLDEVMLYLSQNQVATASVSSGNLVGSIGEL